MDTRGNTDDATPEVTPLSAETLRGRPLPRPPDGGDKEERGRILVIGGSREMPGAATLAGTAALRAGAGKLTIATCASAAHLVALMMPESRVISLPESGTCLIASEAAAALQSVAAESDAVVIGPGMQDERGVCELVAALMPGLSDTKVVLDAYAMSVLLANTATATGGTQSTQRPYRRRFTSPVVMTPHAGEMAHLTGIPKKTVLAQPVETARDAALRWNAVVVLKGATTFIAGTNGRVCRHEGGNIGLAVSGSGDTLAGIIGGLAARGATLEDAAAWGVVLHARAGDALAARFGPLGYLAREIAAEVPALMHALGT